MIIQIKRESLVIMLFCFIMAISILFEVEKVYADTGRFAEEKTTDEVTVYSSEDGEQGVINVNDWSNFTNDIW